MGVSKDDKKKIFEPDSLELVEFQINGKTKYLPVYFFLLSDYLYDLFQSSCNSNEKWFDASLSESEKGWISNKVEEWKRFYKDGVPLSGAFWVNIENWYENFDSKIPKWDSYQAGRAFNMDSKGGKARLLETLSVQNYGELDELLDSLSDPGDPLKDHRKDAYMELKEHKEKNAKKAKKKNKKSNKEVKMRDTIGNVKNVVVDEFKELVNTSGAADIALGRMMYNNIKATMGRTVVKIGFVDRMVAKVSKKMKYKNEVTELVGVLAALVVLKQFYDHKALENVRGYIVNRLYTIGIESTGADDILALMKQAETQVIND